MANFEINQAIIHIPEGVCRVTDLIERNISGIGARKYYVLTPVYDRGAKIYVPADTDSSATSNRSSPVMSDISFRDRNT